MFIPVKNGIFKPVLTHEPILKRTSSQEYSKLAAEGGMKTMFQDGLTKATLGQTTLEELVRVTKV